MEPTTVQNEFALMLQDRVIELERQNADMHRELARLASTSGASDPRLVVEPHRHASTYLLVDNAGMTYGEGRKVLLRLGQLVRLREAFMGFGDMADRTGLWFLVNPVAWPGHGHQSGVLAAAVLKAADEVLGPGRVLECRIYTWLRYNSDVAYVQWSADGAPVRSYIGAVNRRVEYDGVGNVQPRAPRARRERCSIM